MVSGPGPPQADPELSEQEKVTEALKAGLLYVQDEGGYRRFVRARCPQDNHVASVYMTSTAVGGSGTYISSVRFKCPSCDHIFEAKPEQMFLG